MCSVGDSDPEPDTDPQDPHVFGPPGSRSGSISQRGTDPDQADPEFDPDLDLLGRGTDPRIRIRTKMTRRIPNTAYLKLIFFVHIVALCGQAAATIIMKHENRLLGG
jgi:hypothetical protein